MRAIILCQIPDPNASSAITADDLALVWMDNNIVDSASMRVTALDSTTSCLPDLDCAILRACDHPFSLAMECDTSDVSRVALKREKRVRVCRFDIVQLDSMMTSCRKKTLVGRDA